jgi:hypothetical protein
MEEQSRTSDQSTAKVVRMSSSSKGASTATADLMGSEIDPGGDTSLAKRESSFCSSVGVSAWA